MPIESRVYWPASLTVHEVYGSVSRKEFGETLHSFFKETGPTKNVLWDIRKVAWDMVPAQEVLDALAEGMRIYHEELGTRRGGRTAVVVAGDIGLGFATLSQMLLDAYRPPLPFKVKIFSDTTAANAWLANHQPNV